MKTILSTMICALLASGPAAALDIAAHGELQDFIKRMARDHDFSEQELNGLFARIQLRPQVVAAMQRPAERLPWHRYRKLFVTTAQVNKGLRFWEQHSATLRRAEEVYGVPASVLVAIIGVETRYGSNKGSHPVIESLTTLTLQYPRRSKFFGKELEQFLLLTREEEFDPLSIKGSYAGAIGIPQFMPSSYRGYAVDFDGNGVRNLVDETDDAIGSVANYLKRYKWRAGKPIAASATVTAQAEAQADALVATKLRPNTTLKALRAAGTAVDGAFGDDAKVALVRLEAEQGSEYRVTFDNFYVITRYNPSILYAMAVFELSEALNRGRLISG